MLAAGGAQVRVGGFRRGAAPLLVGDAPPINLGITRDRQLWQRCYAVMRNLLQRRNVRRATARADVLLARNLEMLVLAAAVRRPQQRLVYECLDLHRLLLAKGIGARLVQQVEAALLARCDLVIVSSPAYGDHLRQQRYQGPVLLVENKLWGAAAPRPPARRHSEPWRIAWLGVLRCRRSLHLLRTIAIAADGRVEIVIAGRIAHASIPDFDAVVAGCRHLRYIGPYQPAELPDIYGGADFAWTIDYYEAGLNSQRLLPNRLYESLAHGVVPIALAHVATGAWLTRYGVGVLVGDPAVELSSRLSNLDDRGYAVLADAVRALPREAVVAGAADATALVEALTG